MPAARPTSALVLSGLALAACGGGAAHVEALPPPPEPVTRATLVGPLCDTERCRCKAGDDDAGRPEAGFKRYEIVLGPADHELWATVDGMTLFKSREQATACFYVDLRPGEHPVVLRGAGEPAVGFEATIAEQGGNEDRAWWYASFAFSCGAPGSCDRAALQEFLAGVKARKGKLDPCGSTKVLRPTWHSGRMPDHGRPNDLQVALALQVYAFTPENPPGGAACGEAAE